MTGGIIILSLFIINAGNAIPLQILTIAILNNNVFRSKGINLLLFHCFSIKVKI